MTMKLVQAKDTGNQIYLQVWLDTTKELMVPDVDADGTPLKDADGQPVLIASPGVPDPEWLREWRWGKDIKPSDYRRETKLLAKVELNKMNAASAVITLADEGTLL